MNRVTKSNLNEVLEHLKTIDTLVWDCETTGLRAYHDSNLFSLAVADLDGHSWYFNFKSYKDLPDEFVLEAGDVLPLMQTNRRWIAHNAKFDLHFTDKLGIAPQGAIYDTEILARIYQNHHQYRGGYSLAACAERWLSVRKDDRVKAWLDENGAFTVYPNSQGREFKNYYFELVPFEMISEYACQDAVVTGQLYNYLMDNMYETAVVQVESQLTPVLFEMEKLGLRIDRQYCQAAFDFECEKIGALKEKCVSICGPDFMDSAKFLAPLLESRGFVLPQTDKGNPQITDEVLRQKQDELAGLILELRDALKRSTTYWANYLYLADKNDVIHPNFRQSGTVTGRMSCDNPNLQNIPGEDNGPYPLRRAFIPREGFTFVSVDYAQMEFRLMLEYAREHGLIEKIKAGHDPHDSTAELTGLSRKAAKTLNFGLLYGMGVARLANAIGVTDDEAKRFKYKYFDALPGVRGFIRESSKRMEARGFTFGWSGRRYQLEDPKWAYKAANAIIQGGCADICKLAMVRLSDFLLPHRSRMVLQVHDEVLFEVALDELHLVPKLVEIMEQAYEAKNMPLACSVSVGENFHDMGEVKYDSVGGLLREIEGVAG